MTLTARPRETTLRFALAVLAVTVSALAVGESTWFGIERFQPTEVVLGCARADEPVEVAQCDAAQRDRVEWTLLWAPGVLLVGGMVTGVSSMLRRRKSQALPLAKLPSLSRINEAAAASLRVSPVALHWRPRKPIASARADGIVRSYVEVGPQLIALSASNPTRVQAVLTHEYAHLRARDVLPTRFVMGSVIALVASAVPLLITLRDEPMSGALRVVGRLLVIGALVAVARASILRAREFDADADAFESLPDALLASLTDQGLNQPSPWTRIRRLLAHHPSSTVRRDALVSHVRPLSAIDGALAAATAAVGAPVVTRLVSDWSRRGTAFTFPAAVGWGIVGMLLGAWLAVVMGRQHLGNLPASDRHLRRFAVVVGAFILIGGFVLSGPLTGDGRPSPRHVTDVLSALVVAGGVTVLVLWCADIAGWLLPVRWSKAAWLCGAIGGGLLLGNVGQFDHTTGLFVGQGGGQFPDIDLWISVAPFGQAQTGEWFATSLFLFAALVPVALALMTRLDGRAVLTAATAGIVAGGVGTLAFWLLREIGEPHVQAREHGWFAALATAYLYPAVLGGVAGIVGGLATSVIPARRVALAGLIGTVGSVVASLGGWLILGRSDTSFGSILRDTALFGVICSFVIGAGFSLWGGDRLVGRPRHMVALGSVTSLAAIGLAFIAGHSVATATPSLSTDRAYYVTSVFRLLDEAPNVEEVFISACDEVIQDSDLDTARSLRERIGSPLYQPGTTQVGLVHDQWLSAVDLCIDNLERADEAGRSSVPAAEITDLVELYNEWGSNLLELEGLVNES